MAAIYFYAVPFNKNEVTLALESGVDGVIVPSSEVEAVSVLSRCPVLSSDTVRFHEINSKADEEEILAQLQENRNVILARNWEIIPVENLLAQSDKVWAEAENLERARLAAGILERGVSAIVVPHEAVAQLKEIVSACKIRQGEEHLVAGRVTRVENAGLGHRVCLDTLSLLGKGQGVLVGNSSAFTFLVHAETEHNEYVASRPFRINAGGVHSYIRLPHDKTSYLCEMKAGGEILVVDYLGDTSLAVLGRVKIEVRPMLLIEAEVTTGSGATKTGTIFLQNAETIRLTTPNGEPVSVVALKPGDEVLCCLDEPGRHFGMRVKEDIREV